MGIDSWIDERREREREFLCPRIGRIGQDSGENFEGVLFEGCFEWIEGY